ncbi:MAG: ATP-binding protein [Zetaproteobacteria bacterium]|nr:ATP-binding protein [Zetaproteobacteria bacterium]
MLILQALLTAAVTTAEDLHYSVLVTLACLGAALPFAFVFANNITTRLTLIRTTLQKMQQDDLGEELPAVSKDEIGHVTRELNQMRHSLQQTRQETAAHSHDLEQTIEQYRTTNLMHKAKLGQILEHARLGILFCNEHLHIEAEMSSFTTNILQQAPRDLINQHVSKFLLQPSTLSSAEQQTIVHALAAILGQHTIAWDFNSDHLPQTITLCHGGGQQHLHLQWIPLSENQETTDKLILLLFPQPKGPLPHAQHTDMEPENVRLVQELTYSDYDKTARYLKTTAKSLAYISTQIDHKYKTPELLRTLHTIKGGARLLKIASIQELAHEIEEYLQTPSPDEGSTNIHLKSQIQELQTEVKRYDYALQLFRNATDQLPQEKEQGSLGSMVGARIAPLAQICSEAGHPIEEISINDQVVYWDQTVVSDIENIIMHAANNSVDHGYIYSATDRENHAKISLDFKAYPKEDKIYIEVTDQGQGFDIERIRKKLEQKGVATNHLQPEELLQMLFEGKTPISTADQVSHSSGRGIGLSVIQELAHNLGGKAHAKVNKPKGATITVTIPKAKAFARGIN